MTLSTSSVLLILTMASGLLNGTKVPDSINTKMSDDDKVIAQELMRETGITDGAKLVRYCLRAAHREMSTLRGSGISRAPRQHKPVDERG